MTLLTAVLLYRLYYVVYLLVLRELVVEIDSFRLWYQFLFLIWTHLRYVLHIARVFRIQARRILHHVYLMLLICWKILNCVQRILPLRLQYYFVLSTSLKVILLLDTSIYQWLILLWKAWWLIVIWIIVLYIYRLGLVTDVDGWSVSYDLLVLLGIL